MTTALIYLWDNNFHVEKPICCNVLANAFQSGTDNEGYGPLAYGFITNPVKISIGSIESQINFCPWCGFEISKLDWKK